METETGLFLFPRGSLDLKPPASKAQWKSKNSSPNNHLTPKSLEAYQRKINSGELGGLFTPNRRDVSEGMLM